MVRGGCRENASREVTNYAKHVKRRQFSLIDSS